MKKIFRNLKFGLALCAGLFAASCSDVDEAMDAVDRVSEKYKNDPVRLQTEMNAVNEKYGHLEDFVNAITDADNAGKLDKENDGRLELLQRRLLKMMGLNPDELMKETAHDAENI